MRTGELRHGTMRTPLPFRRTDPARELPGVQSGKVKTGPTQDRRRDDRSPRPANAEQIEQPLELGRRPLAAAWRRNVLFVQGGCGIRLSFVTPSACSLHDRRREIKQSSAAHAL
jgi:hypothetical protein